MWLRGGGNVKRFIARGLLAILMLSLAGATDRANAQGLSGQIGGSVIDGSGAAIPGATVSVRNTTTAVTRETTTDGEGLFVFTNLFAGTYDLRVTLTGFRTH
jgi:Carboxypeptidase regulatory-like domain